MKKIFGIILSSTIMLTSVLPAYANTTPDWIKRSISNSVSSTIDQISNSYYDDEGFVEKYNDTTKEFITNMRDPHKFDYDINSSYYGMYGIDEDVNMAFGYNDDGQSILADFSFAMGDENADGSIYIDDYKIVVDVKEIYEKPIVYNFGDDPGFLGLYDTDYVDYLKYSNIKFYVNKFIDLIESGLLEEMYEDYYNNLIQNILKAKMTKEDNIITVKIDGKLIQSYLKQLATKIKDDDRFDQLIDYIERIDAEKYYAYVDEFADELYDSADYIDHSITILYTGEIDNGLLVKNTLDLGYEYDSEFEVEISLTADLDFDNGFVGDFKAKSYYFDEEVSSKLSVKDENGGKRILATFEENDETMLEYNLLTKINGLNIESKGTMTVYSDPYYYITEEPEKPTPLDYEEWLADYTYELEYNLDLLEYVEARMAEAEKMLDDSVSEKLYVDLDDYRIYDFLDYYYFDSYDSMSELINMEDGQILKVEEFYYGLKDYKDSLEFDVNLYNEKNNKEFLAKKYDEYVENYAYNDEYYEWEMEKYEEYLAFKESGRDKDKLQVYIESNESLSPSSIEAKVNTSTSQNDKVLYSNKIDMSIKNSSDKNTIDISDSIQFLDYVEMMKNGIY